MTDTLTSERSLSQVRSAADGWLPEVLACGLGQRFAWNQGMEEADTAWAMVAPHRCATGSVRKYLCDRLSDYVIDLQSSAMPSDTYTWAVNPPPGLGFRGLAAVLASAQEPARNDWGSLFLVSDEESPIPALSDTFLSHVREAFVVTCPRSELGEWAELAYLRAKELLPADVEYPQRAADPENEAEWWLAIVAKCQGSVATILEAYDRLVERFVTEVPAEARGRIRFEIRIDD